MLKVLITGAAGFTARSLVRSLRADPTPKCIMGIDRSTTDCAGYDAFREVDLRDGAALRKLVGETNPEWIFHLAGMLKGSAAELYQANLQNSVNLLEAVAHETPKARLLLIGSAAEYGFSEAMDGIPISETHPCDPRGPYGISKYAMTLGALDFARRTSIRVNVARTFNLIGLGSPQALLVGALIERISEAIKTGAETITVGNVYAERDFIDVRDAVDAYIKIIKSEANGEVINICSGKPIRILELVEGALGFAPRKIGYRIDPALVRSDDPKCVIGNPAKMNALGARASISIEKSLADMCAGLSAK